MKIVDYFSQDEINNFLDYVGDSTPGEARTLARQEVEDLWLLVQDEFDAEGIARSQAGLGDAINYLMDIYHEQRREFSENVPMAAKGLKSYRYKGPYGWIMIGAVDDADAKREAARSTSARIDSRNLQVWNGSRYVNVRKRR